MKLATRRALQRITRLTRAGETAQGFDLFAFQAMRKSADIPVERLHAYYDYSAAVRYLVKIVPIDEAEVLQETRVEARLHPNLKPSPASCAASPVHRRPLPGWCWWMAWGRWTRRARQAPARRRCRML